MATIAAGLSVALPATFITHPFDTISTAMQNDLQKKNYRNMLQSIRAYTQINGYKSLFKGLVPRATSAAARVPALIYVQENLTHHFNKNYKN
jgi:hypothetical protein